MYQCWYDRTLLFSSNHRLQKGDWEGKIKLGGRRGSNWVMKRGMGIPQSAAKGGWDVRLDAWAWPSAVLWGPPSQPIVRSRCPRASLSLVSATVTPPPLSLFYFYLRLNAFINHIINETLLHAFQISPSFSTSFTFLKK